MKKQIINLGLVVLAIVFFAACGGGGAKLTPKGEQLCAKSWKLDVNSSLSDATGQLDTATGIKADIKLDGDVKAIADFMAETLTFGVDQKDKSKLSYEKKYGEGLLSTSVLGFWEMSADEKFVIMREWDYTAGKEKDPVKYEIVELTGEKLVLKKEGDVSANIYTAK